MRLTWMEADRESDADEDKMDRHGQSSGNTMLAREWQRWAECDNKATKKNRLAEMDSDAQKNLDGAGRKIETYVVDWEVLQWAGIKAEADKKKKY